MRKYLLALIILLIPNLLFAANWYVRPTFTGTHNGQSWTTAWNGMGGIAWASVSCGDTIWISGGSYTQQLLIDDMDCTSGSQLYIRRARSGASECTGASGWDAGYDADIVHNVSAHTISVHTASYVTVSGRKTAGGVTGIDNTANGWYIDRRTRTANHGIEFYPGMVSSYITFEYIKIEGQGHLDFTGEARGIDDTPFDSVSGSGDHHTFSHMEICGMESGMYWLNSTNGLYEYVDQHDNGALNAATFHPDVIYTASTSNMVIRYNKFHANDGEGIFFTPANSCDNWLIYGNLFYHIKDGFGSSGTGAKVIELQTGSITNLRIFNNTFRDNNAGMDFVDDEGTCGTGCESRNNLIYGTGGIIDCGTQSNNLTASSDPFVDKATDNYHIISTTGAGYPKDAGINLSDHFTADPDGTTYGADGNWDIGAYEYAGDVRPGGSTNILIPHGLHLGPHR